MKKKLKLILPEKKSEELLALLGVMRERERGEKGDKGDSIKGDKGDRGEKGKDGRNGKDGKDGHEGVDGKDGKDGVDGIDGAMGLIDDATIGYLETEIKRVETIANKSKYTRDNIGVVVRGLTAGTNVTIDSSNMEYPTISATGGGGAVDSVNGETGIVVLDTDDIAEGATNLYNKTHTGEVTGATVLTVDKTAITNKTGVVPVGADYILFSDTSDSGNLKKALVSDLPTGGSGSFAVTETEVDFGTIPVTDRTFTITDASITGTSKIMVTESGSVGTGRVATGDSLWDTITYSCVPAAGSFTLYARASGAVVGYRKLFYTYS